MRRGSEFDLIANLSLKRSTSLVVWDNSNMVLSRWEPSLSCPIMSSWYFCIRKSILSSSTSSAKRFLILEAGSRLKCWSVSFSCKGRLNDFWSHWKASLNCCHVTFFPWIFRERGFPLKLLFSKLFLIFFMLCFGSIIKTIGVPEWMLVAINLSATGSLPLKWSLTNCLLHSAPSRMHQ